jgi:hypothetical protein
MAPMSLFLNPAPSRTSIKQISTFYKNSTELGGRIEKILLTTDSIYYI